MLGRTFLIDGRFLESMSTGIDRYAAETIKELDKICGKKDIRILVPDTVRGTDSEGDRLVSRLKNIRVVYAKRGKHWTQVTFALNTWRMLAVPVTLCNEVAEYAPKGIICLHDVCYRDCMAMFSIDEMQWFMSLYSRVTSKAKTLITVSGFSRRRITAVLGIDSPKVKMYVAGNGWQHFTSIVPDEDIFDKLKNIEKGKYYFTLTSANANKNLGWLVAASMYNPESQFVIAGRNIDKVVKFEKYPNLHYAGAVTDGEAKALMQHCKAFIFPSSYEGFGIPPLEALSVGAKVIVSKIAVFQEIFGESAYYIDPDDDEVDIDEVLSSEVAGADAVLEKYSWEKTAAIVMTAINEFWKFWVQRDKMW